MKNSIVVKNSGLEKKEINENSTIERHVYDVDVFLIYDELKKIYSDPKNKNLVDLSRVLTLLEDEERIYVKVMKETGLDLSQNQKYRHYILPSSSNAYSTYLSLKILTIDPYRIEALLSYQSVLFLGNYYAVKDNFIGLIEFMVFEIVKSRNYLNEVIRLEKIMNWVERNREFILNKAYSGDNQLETAEFRIITMSPEFANILFQKFQYFFSEGQRSLLFELIVKGKGNSKLCFNGNRNAIAEFFKRLRYNKRIIVEKNEVLAKWITDNFVVSNELNEIELLNYETILNVLRRTAKEPAKGSRILEDLAEFILPKNRKQVKIN